jgi:hypothetical protein
MLCRRQFLVASFALTSSCVVGCADLKEREAAERVLDHHFDALKRRTFDSALADYDNHFFTEMSRAEWRVALTSVVDKLGSFRSYQIVSSGLAYKKVAGPGSYLRFHCLVTYSKHTAEETFYLFREQSSKQFKIVGHQIDADGLSK